MRLWTSRTLVEFGIAAMIAISGISMQAQIGDPATLIKEKLVSQIKLSKTSAAHDDVGTRIRP